MEKDLLIVGTTGKLGSSVWAHFASRAIGTTRRQGRSPSLIPFDLSTDASLGLGKQSTIKHAIIIAAMSNPTDCFRNPDLSHQVNVVNTCFLLEELKRAQIKPIFFSTEMVFDGERGKYTESDPKNPRLLYGTQKSRVEEFIQECFEDFLILRLAKIYGESNSDTAILNQFVGGYLSSEVPSYADDQWFSPTWQRDVLTVLDGALSNNLSGLYHLSSGLRYSRWNFYIEFVRRAGLKFRGNRCSILDVATSEPLPHDLSLSNLRLLDKVNLRFTTVAEGISHYLNRNKDSMRGAIPIEYWEDQGFLHET